MTQKMSCIALEAVLVTILLFLPIVRSGEDAVIPADAAQLNSWFNRNIGLATTRKATLAPALATAEVNPKVIKVRADGSGDFKTITEAVNSVPKDNTNRVVVSIGPGKYNEKITIDRYKPFITLHGDPTNMPTLVYGGTAAKYGTVYSATLSVDSDYFSAANLIIVNSAPRPDGKTAGAQAVAMRVIGNAASFYNCKFYGFQDTVCDDDGKHFFKDCYIEGTYDFIFGAGISLYLNTEIHVVPGGNSITAHSRSKSDEPTGYVFVHCKVTGSGSDGLAFLGRSWFAYARVVFAYSEMSDVVNPEGWSNNGKQEDSSTVYFGEYNNKGPGATPEKRAPFTKKLNDADVKPFLSLSYIDGATWLLPPQ